MDAPGPILDLGFVNLDEVALLVANMLRASLGAGSSSCPEVRDESQDPGSAQGGLDDYGYSPRGKPAEKILREWFTEKPRPATTSPAQKEPVEADDSEPDPVQP